MVLRFDDQMAGSNQNKLEKFEYFLWKYHKDVAGRLTSLIEFDFKTWDDAVKELTNFSQEISTKLRQLIVSGVSSFIQITILNSQEY